MTNFFTIGVYLIGLVTLVDQGTKAWVVSFMRNAPHPIEVTSFFNIVLSFNRGVTFGFLSQQNEYMPYVLTVLALAIVVLLVFWLARAKTLLESLGLGLIIGGAIGNVIDRAHFGAVVDFLDFHYAGYHWYAFNVADSAIVSGVFLLLLDGLLAKKENGST